MTHSHALDLELLEPRSRATTGATSGSSDRASKRDQFEKRLAARGCPPKHSRGSRVRSASGLAIRSKEPGAIAVAVAAEMLALRERAVASEPAGQRTHA